MNLLACGHSWILGSLQMISTKNLRIVVFYHFKVEVIDLVMAL